MTDRIPLLERAAYCYEQAGMLVESARCWEQTHSPGPAARLYERAGELADAARCYLAATDPAAAVRCHLRLGQPELAAQCWEQCGDQLSAAWVLLTATRQSARARWLLELSLPAECEARHQIATALCVALDGGGPGALVSSLGAVERDIANIRRVEERRLTVTWAVTAADLFGRHDLSAQLLAALYRCGDRTALGAWQRWATQTLGGTAGLPAEHVATS